MNIPYVTKKATRPKPWQGAILGIFGFLTIVLATMVPGYVTTKGAMDNGVLFALLLGSITPIRLVLREAWRCSRAKRLETGLRITGRPALPLTNYRRRSAKVQSSRLTGF